MNIPPMQGISSQSEFFIYTAADTVYFDLFARPLIYSILKNAPDFGIHIHIYNPLPDQLTFCKKSNVSCTYETLNHSEFKDVRNYWSKKNMYSNRRQKKMYQREKTFGYDEFNRLIRQTYYACARFVRLAEILSKGQRCIALDVDSLVLGPFNHQLGDFDIYLHVDPEDKEHYGSAILFNGTVASDNFLKEYADVLKSSINCDDFYWFLDQIALEQIVPKYKTGQLSRGYLDWEMLPDSPIWSAKGARKELEIFKQEQRKYT